MSLSSAYGILGNSPKSPHDDASDYYQIDFVSFGSAYTCTRLTRSQQCK